MKKGYFVLAAGTLILIITAIILGGAGIAYFADFPSIALVILISVLLLSTNYSPAEFLTAFRTGFPGGSRDRKVIEKSINLFDSLGKYLIVSAVLGSMSGFISMLVAFSGAGDTGAEKWAAGSALAVLTIFYSLILYMIVALPFKTGLKNILIDLD